LQNMTNILILTSNYVSKKTSKICIHCRSCLNFYLILIKKMLFPSSSIYKVFKKYSSYLFISLYSFYEIKIKLVILFFEQICGFYNHKYHLIFLSIGQKFQKKHRKLVMLSIMNDFWMVLDDFE